jgi:hypothetical protein
MKYLLTGILLGICAIIFNSCEQEKNDNPSACNGTYNFCVSMDGSQLEGNATFQKIASDHYKILWESTNPVFQNIKIDIYSSSSGSLNIDSTATSGNAQFEYFDGISYYGGSGRVVVQNISTTEINGTFNATTDGAGTVKTFTDGNFVNVPRQ